MSEKHDRIFLQDGDGTEWLEEGTTWCQDRINDDDTEYVRADLHAALEARLSKMERERDLYCQLAVFKDAKSISFNDQHDYGLAIYTLRDLPLTKEFELDELAWAHHAQGNTSKGDWEYFRDEWLSRWREALAGGDDG